MGIIDGLLAIGLIITFTWLFILTAEFSRFEKYDDSNIREKLKSIKKWLVEARILDKEISVYALSKSYNVSDEFKQLYEKVDALLEEQGLELQKVEEHYELVEKEDDSSD